MKLSLNDENDFMLEEVFNPITFQTEYDEGLGVQMRDTGFDVVYIAAGKKTYDRAKRG